MTSEVEVIKADNTREVFRSEKLVSSLVRSGADKKVADTILSAIQNELHDGMTTAEIYRRAYRLLRKGAQEVADRYSLRRAVLALGPTGFPFEKFVAEIFKRKGYEVEVGRILEGKCISHEVDIVAKKDGHTVGIEAKFRNRIGDRSDSKVALYVSARFNDLTRGADERGEKCSIDHGMIVTNTKFTKNAIQFGECVGVKLIGWTYPGKGNLQDLIEETKAHPLTALGTLSKAEKDRILKDGEVMCTRLVEDDSILQRAGVSQDKAKRAVEEVRRVCAV
jgi:hypothetical protein